MPGHVQPDSWLEWYRFARRTLELTPVDAASYASARTLEDQNREHARDRFDRAERPSLFNRSWGEDTRRIGSG